MNWEADTQYPCAWPQLVLQSCMQCSIATMAQVQENHACLVHICFCGVLFLHLDQVLKTACRNILPGLCHQPWVQLKAHSSGLICLCGRDEQLSGATPQIVDCILPCELSQPQRSPLYFSGGSMKRCQILPKW